MRLDIGSEQDRRDALSRVRWVGRPRLASVRLELPWLPPERRPREEAALLRLFNDCGCAWGAPSALAAVALALTSRLADGWQGPDAAVALTAFAAGGVAGKLAGLALSRWRLRSRLEALAEPAMDPASAGEPLTGPAQAAARP